MNTDVRKWIEKDGIAFLRQIGIREGYKVLDFGCGDGHYTIPASKIVKEDGRVYALDKSRLTTNALKRVAEKNNLKNIEPIHGKDTIPLENSSLDAVLFYDVIHYESESNRKKIYREILRVLKSQGLFSVYPKHYKDDYPMGKLALLGLSDIIREIEGPGFVLYNRFNTTLLHDNHVNTGVVLNFRMKPFGNV